MDTLLSRRYRRGFQSEGGWRAEHHCHCLTTAATRSFHNSHHGRGELEFAEPPVLQKEAARTEERAKQRGEQSAHFNQASDDKYKLYLCLPSPDNSHDMTHNTDTVGRPTDTETTDCLDPNISESGSGVSNLQDYLCELMADTCHAGAEASDERIIKARDDGFSTNIVRDYVATLTDRSVERRLRNQNRN